MILGASQGNSQTYVVTATPMGVTASTLLNLFLRLDPLTRHQTLTMRALHLTNSRDDESYSECSCKDYGQKLYTESPHHC